MNPRLLISFFLLLSLQGWGQSCDSVNVYFRGFNRMDRFMALEESMMASCKPYVMKGKCAEKLFTEYFAWKNEILKDSSKCVGNDVIYLVCEFKLDGNIEMLSFSKDGCTTGINKKYYFRNHQMLISLCKNTHNRKMKKSIKRLLHMQSKLNLCN